MSMPYYVSPEQMMQDRADYARKGIARGRSLIALQYAQGIVLVAENPSSTLRKISEIYDRIAFAGVGKYSEFDQLRVAGVRAADLKGYQFSRQDVDARSLANQYAQLIANTFTHEVKPLEIEILVVEVGSSQATDRLYRIMYDGTVLDEERCAVIGGESDEMKTRTASATPTDDIGVAIRNAVAALSGQSRKLGARDLEVAVLERGIARRCFRRLSDDVVAGHLSA
ncbi:MAG: proteasome subunit alpha [Actinomycetota bacterium]